MLLRQVDPGDVEAYVRMRCDPEMMAELGGPVAREGIQDKVQRDVASARSGRSWIEMIVPDEDRPDVVAGNVVIWSHADGGETRRPTDCAGRWVSPWSASVRSSSRAAASSRTTGGSIRRPSSPESLP